MVGRSAVASASHSPAALSRASRFLGSLAAFFASPLSLVSTLSNHGWFAGRSWPPLRAAPRARSVSEKLLSRVNREKRPLSSTPPPWSSGPPAIGNPFTKSSGSCQSGQYMASIRAAIIAMFACPQTIRTCSGIRETSSALRPHVINHWAIVRRVAPATVRTVCMPAPCSRIVLTTLLSRGPGSCASGTTRNCGSVLTSWLPSFVNTPTLGASEEGDCLGQETGGTIRFFRSSCTAQQNSAGTGAPARANSRVKPTRRCGGSGCSSGIGRPADNRTVTAELFVTGRSALSVTKRR
eukprot:scaffold56752_cov66-Phaeocystis_antarctica.AAC.2